MVRPAEPAWTASRTDTFGGKQITIEGEKYVAGLRDWVKNGDRSIYALSDEEFARRVKPGAAGEMEAEKMAAMNRWRERSAQHGAEQKHS